jgi:methylase of polypeptide subunit release factors
MRLNAEQRQALQQLRNLLADAGSDTTPDLSSILDVLGLAGEYRLVSHLGLFLLAEPLTPSARLYVGNDSLALSRLLPPVEGRALDLCAGGGAQALVCAQTATSVTAVELEPLAERVFWINAELNGLSERVEYLIGDLFDPVAGRQFDRIVSNPPFMPVAPGVRYPLYADGGPDGLAVVRRILLGLPEAMAPEGRCQVVGAVLGNSEGPDLSPFERLADEAHLGIAIGCPSSEELDEAMLASCAATALGCDDEGGVKEAFRNHYASLGATRLYYFLLSATHASQPSVYYSDAEVQRVVIGVPTAALP